MHKRSERQNDGNYPSRTADIHENSTEGRTPALYSLLAVGSRCRLLNGGMAGSGGWGLGSGEKPGRADPRFQGTLPATSTGMCSARLPGRTLASSVRRLKQPWRALALRSFSCRCRAFITRGTCGQVRGKEEASDHPGTHTPHPLLRGSAQAPDKEGPPPCGGDHSTLSSPSLALCQTPHSTLTL